MAWPNSPYCRVTWTKATISADGRDDDNYPNWAPALGDKVVLTPSITGSAVYTMDDGSKATVTVKPVNCVIGVGGALFLDDGIDSGDRVEVRVLATDDIRLSVQGWVWTATTSGMKVPFSAPSGGTVDLSNYVLAPAINTTKTWVDRIPELIKIVQDMETGTGTDYFIPQNLVGSGARFRGLFNTVPATLSDPQYGDWIIVMDD